MPPSASNCGVGFSRRSSSDAQIAAIVRCSSSRAAIASYGVSRPARRTTNDDRAIARSRALEGVTCR